MSSKKFIGISLTLAASALLLTGALNLAVNPFAEFNWSLIPSMKIPVRKAKIKIIEQASKNPPETLLMGSSRVQELDPEMIIHGGRGLNLAIYSPTVEDLYAMWKYFLKLNPPPDNLILGLDVSMFKSGPMPTASLYSNPELRGLIPWSTGQKLHYEYLRFRRLFRLYVAVNSLNSLRKFLAGKEPLVKFDSRGMPLLRPGTAEGPLEKDNSKDSLSRPSEKVLEKRRKKRNEMLTWFRQVKYNDFTEIGDFKKQLFENMLADTRRLDVKTMVFLTPMHAEMVELTRRSVPFDEWKDYVRKTSEKHHAMFFDLSDARELSYIPQWAFVDNAHLSSAAAALFSEKLGEMFATGRIVK